MLGPGAIEKIANASALLPICAAFGLLGIFELPAVFAWLSPKELVLVIVAIQFTALLVGLSLSLIALNGANEFNLPRARNAARWGLGLNLFFLIAGIAAFIFIQSLD